VWQLTVTVAVAVWQCVAVWQWQCGTDLAACGAKASPHSCTRSRVLRYTCRSRWTCVAVAVAGGSGSWTVAGWQLDSGSGWVAVAVAVVAVAVDGWQWMGGS
jgi:hypothetical protein